MLSKNEIALKKKLVQKRRELQHKLELLKENQSNEEHKLLPITKHLETIADKLGKNNEKNSSSKMKKIISMSTNEEIPKKAPPSDPPLGEQSARLKNRVRDLQKKIDSMKTENSEIIRDVAKSLKNDSEQVEGSHSRKRKVNRSLLSEFIMSEEKTPKKRGTNQASLSGYIIPEENSPKERNYNSFKEELAAAQANYHLPKYQNEEYSFTNEVNPDDYKLDELINKSVQESKEYVREYIDTPSYHEYLANFSKLAREYIDEMNHDDDKNPTFDHQTGIRHDSFSDKFYIGKEEVKFLPNEKIEIAGTLFEGTKGLYELLFKQDPGHYNAEDLSNYHLILDLSNALYKKFSPSKGKRQLPPYRKVRHNRTRNV